MTTESTPAVALRMTGITKSFPGVMALQDVDLEINEGEVHAIVGENGAGKSTLMKILAGFYQPDKGEIEVGGRKATHWTPREARSRGIGMIYQELNLVPDLSVAENISLGAMPKRGPFVDYRAMNAKAAAVLDELDTDIDPGTRLGDLSISQQQLVEIAKVVARQPNIVVFDEPTSSLGDKETRVLFDVITKMRDRGIAIIYISHRLQEVMEIGDRVTVLRDGRHIETRDVAGITPDEMVSLMVGRDLNEMFPKFDLELGEQVLSVVGASRAGQFDNVTLDVRKHEIVGLAGLVGSGRTEVARALFGLDPLEEGTITLAGKTVKIRSPRQGVAAGVALVPEDRKGQGIIPGLSVRENFTLPVITRITNALLIFLGKERKIVTELADRLKVNPPQVERPLNVFSGGNQQKVVLGKWLLSEPKLLILDEPTRGVDVGAKADIHHIIGEFAQDGGGVLMISSELPELLAVCDRIFVLHEGVISAEISRADATEESVMRAATGQEVAA
ncbi:monosaccharide ABC transporter ATP-binding protein (CUT2 family) [Salinibacterium amurskyense]|uniref:Monosaccharide ABC transporter ATP-binding protein (CUT2 family) n=1 Tax=Salinibacterium amurskyense TaxID=205941 RepID=A0A2M9D5A3_9MICO|nr:sugar ABC transporter ATP-binding protein [Salinibacterium amurskyense]PJJ80904.1 monosaccharide ABC transporter ATP-binding protein (CUT2 family) [Salinibacterium amurskyense]RLQ82950.1 sugar ABC transporter ATP-binding protein [Salinibacterium amurskyense]GHD82092.1 putative ribose/galactose/methyl galactoside import ATP-binding protein 3 [Salinibacterium amurskyense]